MKQHICDRPECGEVIPTGDLDPVEITVRVPGGQHLIRLELCATHRAEVWIALALPDSESTKEKP